MLSAIGEAIERYSASLPMSERIMWARPRDLSHEFLDPRDCALYTYAQYEREGSHTFDSIWTFHIRGLKVNG